MKYLTVCLLCILLVACGSETENNATQINNTAKPKEIDWDALIPAGYLPDEIMEKYQDQLAQFEDDDPQGDVIYQKMLDEINNSPLNPAINNQYIKLPGFIAPLVYQEDRITEFLFVPYFGACIHVPPPPMNQIIWVKVAKGQEINEEIAYSPIWVIGIINTQGQKTELGAAGYSMSDATIELYEDEVPVL